MIKKNVLQGIATILIVLQGSIVFTNITLQNHPLESNHATSFNPNIKHQAMIKLTPSIRSNDSNEQSITIPINLIKNFMEYPDILEEKEILNAPSILNNAKETLFISPGDRIYAKGLKEHGRYLIYRMNSDIRDPENGKILGREVIYNGEAKTIGPNKIDNVIVRDEKAQQYLPENERYSRPRLFGKTAPEFIQIPTQMTVPLVVTKVISEISPGDKLLLIPEDELQRFNFQPHAVSSNFEANIIKVFGSVSGQHIGKNQTIILNKGLKDGLQNGAIFSIYAKLNNKNWVDSEKTKKIMFKNLAFPVNQVGKGMVYKSTEHFAYAIVLENNDAGYIQIGDIAAPANKDLEDIPTYITVPNN